MTPLLAMTQEEAIAAIRQQVSSGGSASSPDLSTLHPYTTLALAALALSLLLLVVRYRRTLRTRHIFATPSSPNPQKLLRDLRKERLLTRQQIRHLTRAASQLPQTRPEVTTPPHPLTLAICPSLRRRPATTTPATAD